MDRSDTHSPRNMLDWVCHPLLVLVIVLLHFLEQATYLISTLILRPWLLASMLAGLDAGPS
jgi:hypothetical protein